MAYGLQLFDGGGNLVFDSSSAVGGVPIGFWSGGAGTLTFPQFAGRSMQAIVISGPEFSYNSADSGGVAIDYALGYPRAVVSTWAPVFMLIVY